MLSVHPASCRLSFHLSSAFCHFALLLRFIHFFQPIFSYIKSHLIVICLFLSIITVCLFLPPHRPPQLTLSHLLNISTYLYLCLLSALTPASHLGLCYFFLSVSPSSVFSYSHFVFYSAALLCLAPSRQGCWQRWARAYLKCHWQSDKRSYGK